MIFSYAALRQVADDGWPQNGDTGGRKSKDEQEKVNKEFFKAYPRGCHKRKSRAILETKYSHKQCHCCGKEFPKGPAKAPDWCYTCYHPHCDDCLSDGEDFPCRSCAGLPVPERLPSLINYYQPMGNRGKFSDQNTDARHSTKHVSHRYEPCNMAMDFLCIQHGDGFSLHTNNGDTNSRCADPPCSIIWSSADIPFSTSEKSWHLAATTWP